VDHLLRDLGGPGLFIVSLVAATIVPLSSEAALIAALRLGLPQWEAFAWATAGNCAGVTVNYYLGRGGRETVLRKMMASRAGRRAQGWWDRWGRWSLLASWLPVVGDPLTLVAGAMRVPFGFFAATAFSVRAVRYLALLPLAP